MVQSWVLLQMNLLLIGLNKMLQSKTKEGDQFSSYTIFTSMVEPVEPMVVKRDCALCYVEMIQNH